MQPEVKVFEFQNVEVHVLVDASGRPWFRRLDVMDLYSYHGSKRSFTSSYMMRWFEPDETRLFKRTECAGVKNAHWMFSSPVVHAVVLLSPSAIYKIALKRRTREGAEFRQWISQEVLPQLQRDGSYTLPPAEKTQRAERLIDLPRVWRSLQSPISTIRRAFTRKKKESLVDLLPK